MKDCDAIAVRRLHLYTRQSLRYRMTGVMMMIYDSRVIGIHTAGVNTSSFLSQQPDLYTASCNMEWCVERDL